jgi:hypothetical protein
MAHPKQTEFKDNKPAGRLVVTIKRQPDCTWKIEPTDPGQVGRINARVATDLTKAESHKNESIDDEWTRRRKANAPLRPPFRHSGHVPILVREGEDVEFQCDPPLAFAVYMGRDPDVQLETNPTFGQGPDNPFGWTTAQVATPGGTVQATVRGPIPENGPADQRFYKVTAWVWEGGPSPTVIDPDGICDR